MASLVKLSGVGLVVKNLAKTGKRLAKGTERGLKKAGLHLQRESMKIVPVQFGNLKASAFTRNIGLGGFKTDIIVGYTASYAVYVHENPNAAHGKAFNAKHASMISARSGSVKSGLFNRGENQQYKFLEKPAREERGVMIRIIKREASL